MTKERKRAAAADRAHMSAITMAVKVPGPKPDWDGAKPGHHPMLPLKPPGKTS
jgi:hypothetical protein